MSVPLERMKETAGGSLRAVAQYDQDSYSVVYERADVAQKPEAIGDMHEKLIIDGLGVEYLESIFQVGELQCTMHRFEEAVCMHFTQGDARGLFVSVDADSDVQLEAFADLCLEETGSA